MKPHRTQFERSPSARRGRRAVATLLAVVFAVVASNLAGLVAPRVCVRCPSDCPMHVKQVRCHEGARGAAAFAAPGRRGSGPQAPGLRSAACKGTPDAVAPSTDPAVAIELVAASIRSSERAPHRYRAGRRLTGSLDPPFHPPRRSLT